MNRPLSARYEKVRRTRFLVKASYVIALLGAGVFLLYNIVESRSKFISRGHAEQNTVSDRDATRPCSMAICHETDEHVFVCRADGTGSCGTIKWEEKKPKYKTIEAIVTMYTPFETCTGKCVNARGRTPIAGKSIACPRQIKFGTKVVIEGHEYECDDRTHMRFNGRFDIFTEDYAEAMEHGKKRLMVRVEL